MSHTAAGPSSGAPGGARLRDFQIRVRVRGARRATLELRGAFDLAAGDLFAAIIGHQLAAGRRYLRLELSGLTFLDCAGLRAIVEAHNQLLARHGRLTLSHVGPRIGRLLRATRLDTALHISDSADPQRRQLLPAELGNA